MNSKILKKLKQYGVLAAAIANSGEGKAAIIYTDISPDHAGGIGGQYLLDLNNDGIDDFRIYHQNQDLLLEPLAIGNEFLGSGAGGGFAYPYTLNAGSLIGSTATGNWLNNGYSVGNATLNYGIYGHFGNWANVTDKYLGLRIELGGVDYYGWVRLDVNVSGSVWTVKDYAFENTPGAPINAGAMGSLPPSAVTADGASLITPYDISNNGDGSDLQVDFNAAPDEATVGEYRVLIVKESSASTFGLTNAQGTASANYTAITPNSSFYYSQIFNSATTDVDGDAIVENIAYRLFILSIADGINATVDSLVIAPTPITLTSPIAADGVSLITASDIDNNGNGSDLQVDFNAAPNELTVGEYRIMVVKESAAATFNLANAQSIGLNDYSVVMPSGSPNYSQVLSNTATDIDGDLIVENQDYRLFVLSIADGANASIDSLVIGSSPFTLTTPIAAGEATFIFGSDIGNNGDGSDLQVDFDAAPDETTVSEYRILIVKESAASTFELSDAQNVSASNYSSVLPNGSVYYTNYFTSTTTDVDGDAIIENFDYRIFVLSKPDGINANADALAQSNFPVMLFTPTTADGVTLITANDVDDNKNGSDLEVQFNAAVDENTIHEYRIMVVKETDATSFQLPDAQAVNMANYTSIIANGSPNYTQVLSNTATDVDGDAIIENLAYRVFVLSAADGFYAGVDSLVTANSPITLTSPVTADGVTMIAATDVDDNNNGADLQADFTAALDETTVGEYRVLVVKDATASTFELSDAQAVGAINYTTILPTGAANYTQVLANTATDVDGDAIVENIAYRLFVLSIADGTNATLDSLVTANNPITLTSPVTADGVTMIAATDVDDNNNGSDLQADFTAAIDESTVGEYRILVAKDATASTFELSDAQAVGAINYTTILPTGAANYTQVLANTATDVDGDAIVENIAYRLFVLSIADGTNATLDSLVTANNPITLTSPVTADGVTMIAATDVDDNNNGSDLQADFTAALDETTVGEYRVLVVKETAAPTFELIDAQAVNLANYTAVTPTGAANYTQVLANTATDVDGDAIVENIAYRLFVLSIADGMYATLDSLVTANNPITLTSPVTADGVSMIAASDVDDNNNGSDLQADFTAAIDESTVGEYRILVAKDATASTFELSDAQAVGAINYTTILPTGAANYSQVLANTATDVDGDAIVENIAYRLFVLSIADGINATLDSLVTANNPITLTSPVTADGVINLSGTDIDDNNNGSDLQADFTAALDETTVGEYRVLVVKETAAPTFELIDAQVVGAINYTTILPTGAANYTQVLANTATDVDGDAIVENVAYRLFVLSIADGFNASLDSLVTANNPITLTSPVTADGVTMIAATDVDDNNNGSDLQADFTAALDETTVGEYRVLIVKETAAPTFELIDAQAVGAINYTTILPTGAANYSQVLANTATDVDGDAIVENIAYRLFVLSIADGINATLDSLVTANNPITLTSPVTADGVTMIAATDVDDNNNGSDLQADFTAALDETTVGEYRVLVVKETAAPTFELIDAQAVNLANYTAVAPTGAANYTQVLANTATDVDGDAIVENIAYRLFVLSIADGINATLDSLVTANNPITLTSPVTADGVTMIAATDVDDNNNGSDLQADFTAAIDESTVGEYRVLVVKETAAPTFELIDAQAVNLANYTAVAPTGATSYTQILANTATDVDGDAIVENIAYRLFVLSIADGTNATLDSLVTANNPITLTSPVTADGVTLINASDINNNGNGSDLFLGFTAAIDESTVAEYRILVAKDATASTFELSDAQAVGAINYTTILPTGAANYTQVLASTATDVDGDAIVENIAYRLFVLSIADGTNATLDSLVTANNPITLTSPLRADGVINLSGTDVDDNGNGADLKVDFNPAPDESTVGEYRILVVKDIFSSVFELSDAQAVGMSEYTSVSPAGQSNYSQLLTSTSTDVDGDIITANTQYRLFVLSIADGTNATLDSLVMADSPTSLVVGINEIFRSNTKVFSTGNNDIVIEFTGDNQEEVTIEIFNVTGQLIDRKTTQDNRIIFANNLSKNQVYLVSISSKKGARVTFKVKI